MEISFSLFGVVGRTRFSLSLTQYFARFNYMLFLSQDKYIITKVNDIKLIKGVKIIERL